MDDSAEPAISKGEKATRFGCGALLVWVAAILACGYLALKRGDEFWYGLFRRH